MQKQLMLIKIFNTNKWKCNAPLQNVNDIFVEEINIELMFTLEVVTGYLNCRFVHVVRFLISHGSVL